MLSVVETCNVVLSEAEDGPVLRREVGKGWGGVLGGIGGSILGAGVGGALGSQMDFGETPEGIPAGINPGTFIGAGLGALAGNIGGKLGGRYIGGKTISNPDEAADFNKMSHRVGYLANAQSHPLAVAGDVVCGLTVGRPLGTMGANIYNAVSDKGAAKRIGYGLPGRISTGLFFGPLTGIVKPDKVNPNR